MRKEQHKNSLKNLTPFKPGRKAHNRKRLVHDGKEYESLTDMAAAFNTSPSLIRYYLRTDKPFCGKWIDYL